MLKEIMQERKLPPVWPDKAVPWEERKEEIRKMVCDYEYGPYPEEDEVSFRNVLTRHGYLSGKAVLKKTEICTKFGTESYTWQILSAAPENAGKVPFFVLIGGFKEMPAWNIPVEEIIDRGFGLITYNYQEITQDTDMLKHDPTPYTEGVLKILLKEQEKTGKNGVGDGTYGALAIWAWAASKALDFAAQDGTFDLERAAVVGHSRLGKAALYAGLMDERFQYVIPNDSGCGGAAVYRGIRGENWEAVAKNFPYWMNGTYQDYVGRLDEVPFDQHFLLAGCAPRKVYVSAASEDIWADYDSMYLGCKAASEVYEKLGLPGFVCPDRLPETGDVFIDGSIGFHMRKGPHDMGREDWNRFMDFMQK